MACGKKLTSWWWTIGWKNSFEIHAAIITWRGSCVSVCVWWLTHRMYVFFFNEAFDWEEPSSSFYFIFSWLLFYSSFSAHRVNVLRPSFVFSYIFLFYFKTFGNDLEPKRKEKKKVGVVVKDKSPKGKRRKVFVFRSFSFVFFLACRR